MKGLLEDLKHALRLYRRTPGASLMAVVVLAVGMAFVASFLSLYSDLLLRPPPGFERGGRIISVGWNDGRNAGGLPRALIERIAGEATTLEYVAGSSPQSFLIGSEREQGVGELVTREFFPGVRPKLMLGRGFVAEEHDPDGEPVVVISWNYWQDKFGGRQDVIGQILEVHPSASTAVNISGPGMPQGPSAEEELPRDFRIVGVMSREFTGTLPSQASSRTMLWMPVERGLPFMQRNVPAQFRETLLRSWTMRGIARRAPGASNTAVIRELSGRFADDDFIRTPGRRYDAIDGIIQNIFIQRETQRQLQLFLGASVLLALVAAANISLFLLARAPGRRRELGIRMAVGAPLRRLARQLVSEAAVLVAMAAVLGLGLSIWLARFLRDLPFLRRAQWHDVTLLDWRVLGIVGLFLLLVTLLVSLAPVLGLKRLGIAASSRLIAARATIAQRVAGTAQIAIAGVLGGAAIAFAWHLVSVLVADPGYRTNNLYGVILATQGTTTIRVENGQIVGMVDGARRREAIEAIPGVTSVAFGSSAPGLGANSASLTLPDPQDPQQQIRIGMVQIDGRYVDLLRMRLVHGRNLSDGQSDVLVNQAYARRFFGRDDVVGEHAGLSMFVGAGAGQPTTSIAGVLEDLSFRHPLDDVEPLMFIPSSVLPASLAIIETTLTAASLQQQLQEVARKLDLTITGNVQSLATARSETLAPDRARGFLTIGTATLVVLLAGFGFYGTQRYLVTAGRREYAIRASLGAGPRALGRLVMVRGLLLGLPGLVLGVPLAYILVAWLRDDYVRREISPPAVAIAVALGLVALLLVASLGPARLARRTQPAPLLRED